MELRHKAKHVLQRKRINDIVTIDTNECETLPEIRKKKKEAVKIFKHNLTHAKELRLNFLNLQADAWAEVNNQSAEKRLRFLIHMEGRRDSFRKIKYIRGKLQNRSGITHVITTNNSTETTIDDLAILEHTIIERNINHFHQAYQTPFATPPLVDLLGRTATNETSSQILAGEIPINNIG